MKNIQVKNVTKRFVFLILMVAFGFWLNLLVFCLYIAVCLLALSLGNLVAWVFTGDWTFLDEKLLKLLDIFLKLDTKIESIIDR